VSSDIKLCGNTPEIKANYAWEWPTVQGCRAIAWLAFSRIQALGLRHGWLSRGWLLGASKPLKLLMAGPQTNEGLWDCLRLALGRGLWPWPATLAVI